MKKVGIFEAKTHFSALIDEVISGESIVVTKNGRPVARLVPLTTAKPREFGVARELFDSGAIVIADDFDSPLPAGMLKKLLGS